jgi:hypothetical protein
MGKFRDWLKMVFGFQKNYVDPVFEEMHFYEIFNNHEFNEWAFGSSYKIYSYSQKLEKWNKRHGILTVFCLCDEKKKVYNVMEQFWIASKNNTTSNILETSSEGTCQDLKNQ